MRCMVLISQCMFYSLVHVDRRYIKPAIQLHGAEKLHFCGTGSVMPPNPIGQDQRRQQ